MSPQATSGWDELVQSAQAHDPEALRRVEVAFARCFSGDDGARALAHLRTITLDRASGPGASDAALRHLDGQRCLMLHIQSLIDRGRTPR
jgi:hypothetical protein